MKNDNHKITQDGSSLISMALMIIVVGFMISGFLFIYQNQELVNKDQETTYKNEVITAAIDDYVMKYGRYPCPAPLNALRDTPFFGREDPNENCNSANYYNRAGADFTTTRGIVSVAPLPQCGMLPGPPLTCNALPTCRCGDPPGNIKIGTLPVRSLNLTDDFMVDGYGKRYIYAVTERIASPNVAPNEDLGAINISDRSGNSLSSQRAHVKYIFFSLGVSDNGAYDIEGAAITNVAGETCDVSRTDGINCNFQLTATPATASTFEASFFKQY